MKGEVSIVAASQSNIFDACYIFMIKLPAVDCNAALKDVLPRAKKKKEIEIDVYMMSRKITLEKQWIDVNLLEALENREF